ncbi:MAG: ABC transporter substrate-binding protein [Clostridia bacterium]|nr:ABC transporter substrate-binding protein [Clostridia bacterium]
MKKLSKNLSVQVLLLIIIVSMLSGCTGQKVQPDSNRKTESPPSANQETKRPYEGNDISREVKLKMYLVGDKARDFDLVYAEVNKLLKQDINATIETSFLSWSDYERKYPLVFASGEDFDLIYTSNWCFYNGQAVRGAFKEITLDMLQKYAPKTAASIYKEAWAQAKVSGKVYMLPMNYKELNPFVYIVRGDLMEKYGLAEINSIEDFGRYLDAVAKNEKQLIPCDIGSGLDFDALFWSYGQGLIKDKLDGVGGRQTILGYDANDQNDLKIYPLTQEKEFLKFVQIAKQWKEKGYWSKSALVNKMTVRDSFIQGRSASAILNINTANGTYITTNQVHPEWKVKVFDAMYDKGIIQRPFIQNGMAIKADSKNVERSLMLLDLFKNDERYSDLTTYGIKGKHYEITADKKIRPLADTGNYPVDGNCNWGWRDDRLFKQVAGGIPNYTELREKWSKVAYSHPLQFFNFDDSNVKNEIAACTNLFNTSYKALVLGFSDDVEGDVKKLNEKYKQAGIEKIVSEAQKQVNEFLVNYYKP